MSKRFWKRFLLLGFVFLLIVPAHSFAAKNVANKHAKLMMSKGKSSTINNIMAKDVGENGNGSDIEVHFNVAKYKGKYQEHRILVVKTSKAAQFNLKAANKVASGNYTVAPIGKNIRTTLSESAKDTDGSYIQSGVSYTVFVLSVGETNILSKGKKEITLSHSNGIVAVKDLRAADINNYGNAQDLQISFTKLQDEQNLLEYRVFVVKATVAEEFYLSDAKVNSHYTKIAKTGYNISQVLPADAKDSDGNLLRNNVNYDVYVLSVGNNHQGALSSPANITLRNNFSDIQVSNLVVKDVADFGDGRDLQVSFAKPWSEANVDVYRIMVVPVADAYNFNLTKANDVSYPNYTVIAKTGSNIVTRLASTAKDVNGANIVENKRYVIFVLTDGRTTNELSDASSVITLTDNVTTSAATNVQVADVSNYGNGLDLQVTFTKAVDEATVKEYRIFVVKSSQASTFNLVKANTIDAANYTTVTKTGANITQRLSASARDVNGDLITKDVVYRVFVMSVSIVGYDEKNVLSQQSGTIHLD